MMLPALAALALLAVVIALAPRLFDSERIPLDDTARRSAPGRFVALSDGAVHYELMGPEGAPVVVLLPGATLPMFVWDPFVPELTRAGFRVLRYDLYGRGYSDRPSGVYGPDLFERQLLQLLAALRIDGPVHLAGLAFGGLIAVMVAARHPERVRALTLLAPDGFGTELPPAVRVARMPAVGGVLGRYLVRVLGDRTVMSRVPRLFAPGAHPPRVSELTREQLRFHGFKRALLSSLMNQMPIENAAESYRAVARSGIPVTALWGRHDEVTPPELAEKLREVMPHAEIHVLADAGHLLYERPAEVAGIIARSLNSGT